MEVDTEPLKEPAPMAEEGFKAPMAPVQKPAAESKPETSVDELTKGKTVTKSPAEVAYNSKNPPLAYKEPAWAGLLPSEEPTYVLEEIKNGTIVGTHKLVGKSFFVVGRLPTCDIQLEHPSLSRFHAVLQYKSEDSSDKPAGFYLFDLDSTHGTYHNKQRCFTKTFYRLRVGHSVKFGLSTRFLILQGPQADMEEESDLSVTELKALAAEKAKKKAEEEELKRAEEEPESSGISWGISDDDPQEEKESRKERRGGGGDGDEEELPDMENNPFALSASDAGGNEKLYSSDPKKFLKSWFEREGYDDLDFECTEKSFASFHVKIDLPIDVMGTGEAVVVAEVTHKGKKKDAIAHCALEACRLLDKYGVLTSTNSNQESSELKRAKRWEQNDYYSSDEDEYLDRTRTIQDKRQKRMKLAAKTSLTGQEEVKAETFESLSQKHSTLSKEIEESEMELKSAQDALSNAKSLSKQEVSDDLDDYMAALSKTGKGESASKENISKLKQKMNLLKQDLARINRLIEIARPAKMPDFKPRPVDTNSASKLGKFSGIMVGKRKGSGIATTLRTIDSTSKDKKPDLTGIKKVSEKVSEEIKKLTEDNPPKVSKMSFSESVKKNCPTPEEVKIKPPAVQTKKDEIPVFKPVIKPIKAMKMKLATLPPKSDDDEASEPEPEKYISHPEEEEEVWAPPSNQTGDGRTSLNDKFGY